MQNDENNIENTNGKQPKLHVLYIVFKCLAKAYRVLCITQKRYMINVWSIDDLQYTIHAIHMIKIYVLYMCV